MGVKIPVYMPPRIITGRSSTGTAWIKDSITSFRLYFTADAAFLFLFITRLTATKDAASKRPGTMAATNISGIETFIVLPYTIIQILGGITGPREPAAARIPPVSDLLYPFFSIAGSMIAPIAATVAGPEPVRAAKIVQQTMVTVPTLPGAPPRSFSIHPTRRFDRPLDSIR